MAHDTKETPGLNFDFWLTKAVEWGHADSVESQQDVCFHLPKLQEFLLQVHEALKHTNFTAAVKRFPLIGQLLGRLCRNTVVFASDESQKSLIWCLCCLYSSEPQSPVERKANKWIKNLLCHLFSCPEAGSSEESCLIQKLGCTPGYYFSELLNNMVSSLVAELGGNSLNRWNSQGRIIADRVKSMSVLCEALITMTDVSPLLEVLLTYHDFEVEETLSIHFLEAVNDALLQKKIVLSESALLGLWLRHLPSLEKATLHLIERLLSKRGASLDEMEHILEDSWLPQAACHPSIFGVVDEIFKNALLETDGSSNILAIIRLFTRCFVQSHQNDKHKVQLKAFFRRSHSSLVVALLQNPCDLPSATWCQHLKCISDMLKMEVEDTCTKSPTCAFDAWFLLVHFGHWVDIAAERLLLSNTDTANDLLWLLAFYYDPCSMCHKRNQTMMEARTVADRLLLIFGRIKLSLAELYDAVGPNTTSGHSGRDQLIRHLVLIFLMFSSGGVAVAKECIKQMTQTEAAASDVSNILAQTARILNIPGLKNERTMELAHELLREIQYVTKDV
ncbi:Fanconi anemia group C protein isoform X2 [Pleurodeles waltl]|uniref:Fanconi anemia group C protein isoform X2 n=1 Tax=Pleurodeles waltl TaxID=8319 RepID=UPI003709B3B7